jgi:hypothetical protein
MLKVQILYCSKFFNLTGKVHFFSLLIPFTPAEVRGDYEKKKPENEE